jgi:hypothetical protein
MAPSETVDLRGICTTTPQWGHFPFLPAMSGGVRTRIRQLVQKNWIGGPVAAGAGGGAAAPLAGPFAAAAADWEGIWAGIWAGIWTTAEQ